MAVYVIAEAGSSHDGKFARAFDLITAAQGAGADAVKFQYWSNPDQMRVRRHVSVESAYTVGSLDRLWFPDLRAYAARRSLDFLCTVYLPEDIEVVAPYVDRFKISSFEAQDSAFVRAHAPYHKDVIISTGLSGPDTFFHGAVAGKWRSFLSELAPARVQWLHCVSAYPTPYADANISCVTPLNGYSDHTTSLLSGALAVAYGATTIEKHFRLITTSYTCADYDHSLTPLQLSEYVRNIRDAEVLIGDGVKRVMPSEASNMQHLVHRV